MQPSPISDPRARDLTVALGIDAAAGEARKGRIPILPVMPDTVPHGALYAAGPDYYNNRSATSRPA